MLNILLAEDSEDDEILFRRALQRHPDWSVVRCVQDGDQALKYINGEGVFGDRIKHPFPDVLVLDLKMPNRNGFEVLEALQGRCDTLVIAIFSSSDEPRDITRAYQLGAHLYQTKTYETVAFGRFLIWLETLAKAKTKTTEVISATTETVAKTASLLARNRDLQKAQWALGASVVEATNSLQRQMEQTQLPSESEDGKGQSTSAA